MVTAICVVLCFMTMPVTWRLCFPPFPQVRAPELVDLVPLATYDYGGLV